MKSILIIIAILIIYTIVSNTLDSPTIKKEITYNTEAVLTIDGLIINGLIVHRSYAKFYIQPIFWLYLDHTQKEGLAYGCANYYIANGGGILRSELYNNQSGKLLAKYNSFGIKYY